MKTTLNLSDTVMREVKREAARRGQTMTGLVEAALRKEVEPRRAGASLPPLPAFRGGGARVDIADRDALYRAMES